MLILRIAVDCIESQDISSLVVSRQLQPLASRLGASCIQLKIICHLRDELAHADFAYPSTAHRESVEFGQY